MASSCHALETSAKDRRASERRDEGVEKPVVQRRVLRWLVGDGGRDSEERDRIRERSSGGRREMGLGLVGGSIVSVAEGRNKGFHKNAGRLSAGNWAGNTYSSFGLFGES